MARVAKKQIWFDIRKNFPRTSTIHECLKSSVFSLIAKAG